MKINKNMFKRVGVISILILVLLFISGYRLTGIQAAKIHSDIDSGTQLLGKISYKWGNIYFFNTQKGYRTAISERKGLLWKSESYFYMYENYDPLKTVGWASLDDKATAYALEVKDEKVSYIEIGIQSDRIRRYTNEGNPIIFSWDKSVKWNDFNGIAYSKEGVALYEYRYQKDTNYIKKEDLRWYPIK